MDAAPIIMWSTALHQCCDDEAFLRENLREMWGDLRGHLSRIRQHEDDHVTLRRIVHTIKGSAANLYCTRLKNQSEKCIQAMDQDREFHTHLVLLRSEASLLGVYLKRKNIVSQ
jgi:HPt (histidine-containing phosphotransfer) domain-containing protein